MADSPNQSGKYNVSSPSFRQKQERDALYVLNSILQGCSIPLQMRSLQDCTPQLWVVLYERLFSCQVTPLHRLSSQEAVLTWPRKVDNVAIILGLLATRAGDPFLLQTVRPKDVCNKKRSSLLALIHVFGKLFVQIHDEKLKQVKQEVDSSEEESKASTTTVDDTVLAEKWNRFLGTLKEEPTEGGNPNPYKNDDFTTPKKKRDRKEEREEMDFEKEGAVDSSREQTEMMTPEISYETKEWKGTPTPLKVLSSDTPHTKALKLRRRNILKEVARTRSHLVSLHSAKKCFYSPSKRKVVKFQKNPHLREIKPEKADIAKTGKRVVEDEDSEDMNMLDGLDWLRHEVGDQNIPKSVLNKLWGQEVLRKRKRQEGHFFGKKIQHHREKEMKRDTPLRIAMKDADIAKRLKRWKETKMVYRETLSHLEEKKRRLVRAIQRQRDIDNEVAGYYYRRKARQDNFISKVVHQLTQCHRRDIIEEEKRRKEHIKKEQKSKEATHLAKEKYYRDQVELVQEKLNQVQLEEKIAVKAHQETIRGLLRDQKQEAKKHIEKVKEKLQRDEQEEMFFQKVYIQRSLGLP